MTGQFLLSISVFIFSFFISLFCLVPCGRLSWLFASFWAHVNILRRIVSLRRCTSECQRTRDLRIRGYLKQLHAIRCYLSQILYKNPYQIAFNVRSVRAGAVWRRRDALVFACKTLLCYCSPSNFKRMPKDK